MEKIKIKNCGILYQEIIMTAMQEYKGKMNNNGNYCRADVVQEIINKIKFDGFEEE